MKKGISLVLCAACLLSMLAGCAGAQREIVKDVKKGEKSLVETVGDKLANTLPEIDNKKLPNRGEEPVMPQEVVNGENSVERAKAVFMQLDSDTENVLYSPVSLEMAFGLLSEGASDSAKAQILKYLGVEDYAPVAEALMAHSDITNMEDDTAGGLEMMDSGYKTALNYANSLWVRDDHVLKDVFVKKAQESYRAVADAIDVSDPVGTCDKVNSWCDKATNGLISKIIDPSVITNELALILCNSVYFESAWYEPWDVSDGEFKNASGDVMKLSDMLYDTVGTYYETDNAVAFAKGYVSGAKFIGILTKEGVGIEDIDLTALLASETRDYDVHVSMPKLNYDFTGNNLVDILKAIGITEVFDRNALALPGIVDEVGDLYVTDVVQKCKIELDENGTKAAAVTAIMAAMNALPMEPPEFKEVHLNRPFYFMIVDDIDVPGTILFMGAVNSINPEAPVE